MTETNHPTPEQIRAYRSDNPKLRERDIAHNLGVSEAALVAAECGLTAIRIKADANAFLERIEALGEVMALSRNESAVHEKIGVYSNIEPGAHASLVLGDSIDLRIFPRAWVHAFAVTKKDGDQVKHSLQFFDAHGEAVHKVHLREASNLEAYHALVADFRLEDQSQEFVALPKRAAAENADAPVDIAVLRDSWSTLKDTHDFFGMLRRLKLPRQTAIRSVGDDFAWQVHRGAVADLFAGAAATQLSIMVFVANDGIVQIHTGPVANIQTMGPWLNIMDPDFHLHLRTDHIAEVWAVRKPTKDGLVTSLEVFDHKGEMIIQFFGKRKEGSAEMPQWRDLVEGLARHRDEQAA